MRLRRSLIKVVVLGFVVLSSCMGLARRSVEIRRLSGDFVHATSSFDSSLSI